MFLTSTDLGDHSVCQGRALCQLFSKTLAHVVINIIGPQQLLKGLHIVEKLSRCENMDHENVVLPFVYILSQCWHNIEN